MSKTIVAGDIALFIAVIATVLALGGALAHTYEFFAKMSLPRADYFTVQTVYNGWNQLAYVLGVELIAMIVAIILYRHHSGVLWPAVVALSCLLASQVIFWIWTMPANIATDQWTRQPDNWEVLRRNWEYSHVAGAGFQLAAITALIVAMLRRC